MKKCFDVLFGKQLFDEILIIRSFQQIQPVNMYVHTYIFNLIKLLANSGNGENSTANLNKMYILKFLLKKTFY